ncbi:MAG TPA: hypothetical protein VMM12_03840 [Longimicrobiales bacterium]|nr:hypothetical protein [Longimicrobiales bacterium]
MRDPQLRRNRLSVGQALAAAGAVLSLVFVGLEVRQNTKAIRGTTYQAVAEANTDWLAMLALEPELLDLTRRWTAGDTTFTAEERGRIYVLQLHFWRTIENAHYQYLQGNLPEDVVRRWIPPDMFGNPILARWWSGARDRFTPAFVGYVEAVATEADRP